MIILEGCDNSGKTTFAKELSQLTKVHYQHSVKPNDAASALMDMMDSSLPKSKQVIRDRVSIISEMVYGPVVRDKSMLEGHHWNMIDFVLNSPNNILIYCRPPKEDILNFGSREQMEGVIPNAEEILSRYDWIMNLLKSKYKNVIYYNYLGSVEHRVRVTVKIERFLTLRKVYREELLGLENNWEKYYLEEKS